MTTEKQREWRTIRALQDVLAGRVPCVQDQKALAGSVQVCIEALIEALHGGGKEAVYKAFTALQKDQPWLGTLAAQPSPQYNQEAAEYMFQQFYDDLLAEPQKGKEQLQLEDYWPLGDWYDTAVSFLDAWKQDGRAGVKEMVCSINNKQRKTPQEKQLIHLLCSGRDEPEAAGDTMTTQKGGKKRRQKQITLIPKTLDAAHVLTFLNENEYGDARFFAAIFTGQVCYDSTSKDWYLWGGHYWLRDTTGQVRQLVSGELASLYLHAAADLNTTHAALDLKMKTLIGEGVNEADAQIQALKDEYKVVGAQMQSLRDRAWNLRSGKRCKSVLEYIQVELGITSDQWDTNQWALATPNGVIDLHTGLCRDGQPTDYIRTACPTEWTGLYTPCPRFERFLQEIFEDKPDRTELVSFLQRLLGYGITGVTTEHIFPILFGEEGRNGKDTLFGALENTLGPVVGAVSNDVFLAPDKLRSGGSATPHLTDLQGKRLVWGSETKQGDKLNIAQIKLLTGGGTISARPLYGKQFTFTPTHKLLLMTNYKPHADARDKAFWSRACLIEFSLRFVDNPLASNERQADHHLKAALKQERSGILAWLVRGCLDWQQYGLTIPSSILLATSKYREEEDRLLLFIDERCVVAPHAMAGGDELYNAYKAWCKHNQLSMMSGTMFGREMGKRYEKTRTNSRITYQGIGLLEMDDPYPPTQALNKGE